MKDHNLDLFEGRARKEEATSRVLDNAGDEWKNRAMNVLLYVADTTDDFIADDVVVEAEKLGLPEPHHRNAWGSLFLLASKRKYIKKTGETRPTRRPRGHARYYPVWRKSRE